MEKRSVAKDFYRLQKNIHSFSNGEARVIEFDDELISFKVELNIKDGYYKDGIFVFQVRPATKYPVEPVEVRFLSQIFHPNIGDGYEDDLVCLNLLSEDWTETNDFEDVVQGMLFLVKNPALDDALNPIYHFCDLNEDDVDDQQVFAELVRKSLEGGIIDDMEFKRNPGLIEKDRKLTDLKTPNEAELCQENDHTNTKYLSLCERDNSYFQLGKTTMNISSKEEIYRCGLYWVYNNFTNFSTNGKPVYGRGDCPKWLAKLAFLVFGGDEKEKRQGNVNIFSRNLRNLQRFPFFNRALIWNKQ